MAKTDITTIVINWNLKEETGACLRSLKDSQTPTRVIVVDNGSSDGSVETIKKQFPTVEIIALPHNIGFGPACNQAIQWVMERDRPEYFFFLNNDATVTPRTLTELHKVTQDNPQVGVFGAKVLYQSSPNKIWYAGAQRRPIVYAATGFGRGQKDNGQFDQVRQVDYVFGAAMFVRREVIERIGYFDERFFLYLEDLDFCLRVQAAGYGLLYVPTATVKHIGSASTAGDEVWRRYELVKSTVEFLKKHVTPAEWPPVIGFWSLVALRAVATDLWRGNLAAIFAQSRGLLHGLHPHPNGDGPSVPRLDANRNATG